MSDFPTLSVKPSVGPWKESKLPNSTIRSPFEAGYVQTRPRFTRIPKTWSIGYQGGNALPLADKILLEQHEDSVKGGAGIFSWLNVTDGQVYRVRYKDPIQFAPLYNNQFWTVSFVLEQV